jgi:hypothetical protein
MGEVCRWINFIYPGYDGEDERRGDFDGSLEHMSQMLIAMVESRGIEKFVFLWAFDGKYVYGVFCYAL